MAKRPLLPEESRAAARLKSLIAAKRDAEPTFTQVYMAQTLGISQPTLAQYANGVIPLGLDITLQLAELLETSPSAIYPEKVQRVYRVQQQIKEDTVPVMGTVTGNPPTVHQVLVANMSLPRHCYAVCVDSAEYEGFAIPQGAHLVVNPLGALRPNHKVIFRHHGEEDYHAGVLIEITPKALKYRSLVSGKVASQPMKKIRQLHAVVAVQYPAL